MGKAAALLFIQGGIESLHTRIISQPALEILAAHQIPVTYEQLVERIWDTYESYVDENTLNVYIRRLREKLERYIEINKGFRTVYLQFGFSRKY